MWALASCPCVRRIGCWQAIFLRLPQTRSASRSHGRGRPRLQYTLSGGGVVSLAKSFRQRTQYNRRGKHHAGKEQVALHRVAEEWQSQSVRGHQAAKVFWIHVIGSPHGKIADQEEGDRTSKGCT